MTLADLFYLTNMSKGAEFIEPSAFDYPGRGSRMVGQTAFLSGYTLDRAKEGMSFPYEVMSGYLQEQIEHEQMVAILHRSKRNG